MADLKPGYLTTEWWSQVFVHLLSAVAAIFGVLHLDTDTVTKFQNAAGTATSSAQHVNIYSVILSVLAVALSAGSQALYHNKRAQLKAEALAVDAGHWGTVINHYAGEIKPLLPTIEAVGKVANPTLEAKIESVTTEALSDVKQVEGAWGRTLATPVDVPEGVAASHGSDNPSGLLPTDQGSVDMSSQAPVPGPGAANS